MTTDKYVNKTRDAVHFLMNVFGDYPLIVAKIVTAQGEHNAEKLIILLGVVKDNCEKWIKELKAMEE